VRSIIDHPFTHSVTSNRVANVESQVVAHFDHLQTQGRLKNHLLHPAEDTKMLPFWVVCEIFYGRLPSPLLEELRSLAPQRERIFQYVIQGGLTRFTWSQWLPTTANAELLMFQNRWKAFNDAAHSHALVHHPNSPIVQLYLAQQSGKITTAQLLQTLDESLYANLDVTTGGLSWNLVFLASNKCAQSRLRSEVQLAVVEKRLHDYVKSESTYLAACILESSRLKPLAAFSVPQAAPTAREVDGYVIPAGTNFVVDAYALNIRADTWAPDNGTYRPERFLSRRGTELRYRFWRFGFGPRQCMGKYVAEQVIRLTMVYLVLGYELEMTEKGEEWGRSRESWISHPDFELRCVKREG
jgi:cytochrome P450